jgi:hypothetical protein
MQLSADHNLYRTKSEPKESYERPVLAKRKARRDGKYECINANLWTLGGKERERE